MSTGTLSEGLLQFRDEKREKVGRYSNYIYYTRDFISGYFVYERENHQRRKVKQIKNW